MSFKEDKFNNVIKNQIEEAFSTFPNKEELKKQYIDNLGEHHDALYNKKKEENLVGVGNLNDIDWDEIENLNSYNNMDDALFTHKCRCDKCRNSIPCEELKLIADADIDTTVILFTDGDFVELFDMRLIDVKNETIIIKLNIESGTYQVIKSHKIEKHGLASLCYLGQADVNIEGEYQCYVLPENYLLIK